MKFKLEVDLDLSHIDYIQQKDAGLYVQSLMSAMNIHMALLENQLQSATNKDLAKVYLSNDRETIRQLLQFSLSRVEDT